MGIWQNNDVFAFEKVAGCFELPDQLFHRNALIFFLGMNLGNNDVVVFSPQEVLWKSGSEFPIGGTPLARLFGAGLPGDITMHKGYFHYSSRINCGFS